MNRRHFLSLMATAPLLAGSYAWGIEPGWVDYVHLKLPLPNLPENLVGKTFVQLSDLHVGDQVDTGYLVRTFAAISALQPDIVAYTGDFVSYAGRNTFQQLRGLAGRFPRGKLGTVSVLGNHDYGRNWSDATVAGEVARMLADHGCQVLRNQSVSVGGLVIGGVDDLWAGRLQLAPALAGAPSLMLCHNPDGCDLPEWDGFQGWILSGHTHGGQCRPPFLPPPLLPVKNRRYIAGRIELGDGRTLYINRGLGHLLKVRFNVRPEVTIFTLTKA